MSKQNKPQWLIDAEKAINKFNKTDVSTLTDAQLNQRSAFLNSDIQSKSGKAGGKKLVETGKAQVNLNKAIKVAQSKTTCKHCGKEGSHVNIEWHHNDNCKQRPDIIMPILKQLPDTFMRKDMKPLFEQAGIGPQLQRFISGMLWLEVSHKKGTWIVYKKGQKYYDNFETNPTDHI